VVAQEIQILQKGNVGVERIIRLSVVEHNVAVLINVLQVLAHLGGLIVVYQEVVG
jgi:hypothetical protein